MGVAAGRCCERCDDKKTEALDPEGWSREACDVAELTTSEGERAVSKDGGCAASASDDCGDEVREPGEVFQLVNPEEVQAAMEIFIRTVAAEDLQGDFSNRQVSDFARRVSSNYLSRSLADDESEVSDCDDQLSVVSEAEDSESQVPDTDSEGLAEVTPEGDAETEYVYVNHCYFHNLEIRGRHPRCEYGKGKSCKCDRLHERIPDHIFESMGIPDICRVCSKANTSQRLGSDCSLRQIFAEIGAGAEGSFSREELSSFILQTLAGVREGAKDLVVALLCRPETAEERWEEFTFLCRIGLQWQSALSSIVAKNGDQKTQVEAVRSTIKIAPAETMRAGRLTRLLRRARLRIGKEQVAKLVHASSQASVDSVEKAELETLLEALCALARIAQLRDPDRDEVAEQSLHLVHELAQSVYKTSASKRKKTVKPRRDSISVVTKQDFQRLFESLGVPVEEGRLEAVIATFDEDGNGSFEKMECSKLLDVSMKWHNFMQTLARSAQGAGANFSDASLRREFVSIDKDRSGSIDQGELMQCFRHKNIDLDMRTLNKVMVLADSDGSGDIEWPEFRRMFKIIEASLGSWR